MDSSSAHAPARRPGADRPSPDSLADAFAAELSRELGRDGLSAAEDAFVAQMHEDCVGDEIEGVSPADLTATAVDFWAFAGRRTGADPDVRLVDVTGAGGRELNLQALQIVQADAPFLVDSVMGEVTEAGFAVKAMFHPVVELDRDEAGQRRKGAVRRRESMIMALIEPVGPERADALVQGIMSALADVRVAVADFEAMRSLMRGAIAELDKTAPDAVRDEIPEDLDFLRWMTGDHFVFLGARTYTYPRTPEGGYAQEEPVYDAAGSLGVLRDQSRSVLRRDSEPAMLAMATRHYMDGTPLIVAKSNVRSRVHRRTYMDYIGIKRYGPDGRAFGEVRFVGLFTAAAYEQSVREVPLIRRGPGRWRPCAGSAAPRAPTARRRRR